jgi:hypothetical protein
MDISVISLTDIPENPRLLTKDQRPATPVPSHAEPKDPAKLAAEAAQLYAGKAESLASQLKQSIALYNANNAPATQEAAERYQALSGDEMAERASRAMSLLRADAARLIAAQDQALKTQFTVEGETVSYDKTADRYAPGQFRATLETPGYAVRYDSETGAKVSVLGGPFVSAAPRGSQSASLLDIVA